MLFVSCDNWKTLFSQPGPNHGNHGKSSEARELQILPIKIKKDKHKSEFDKV